MSLPKKRKVATVCGDGHIRLIEQDVPELKPGGILVEVHASLVSPGTELGGWRAFSRKRLEPDRDAQPRPFGYSNAGVVLEPGQGVTEFKPGDRVACIGAGHALHTDYAVIPHNLCASLPDALSFVQGSYAHLSATALQCLRRGQPEFGERVAVIGLGVLGQLTAQLYQLAGNFVVGWDIVPFCCEVAKRWGIGATIVPGEDDEVEATRRFTKGYGLDAAVFAFGGDGTEMLQKIEQCMKCAPDTHPMGRIIVIGRTHFQYRPTLTNMDIRRSSRTGPGYHDETWEYGSDYPAVFVRWTTRANIRLCLELIENGKLDVTCLTTHTIPLEEAEEGISSTLDDPDRILGVAFVRQKV